MAAFSPAVRKLALTAHVVASVGWLGSVAAFLALALAGLTASDAETAHGLHVAMDVTARLVILPFSLAALATGIVQSLGTEWGLFRHYWVVAKLLVTVAATLLLILHMKAIGHLAAQPAETALSAHARPIQVQLVADAAAAIVALVLATVLSVYKPKGLTPYGRRRRAADAMGR